MSSLQASTTTQVIVHCLLRNWGQDGFLAHAARVAIFYQHRRDLFLAAAAKYLEGKATWSVPSAGMFLWIHLRLPPGDDSFRLMTDKALAIKILAIPGVDFMPNKSRSCALRLSYSLVAEDDMNEACRRIAILVDEAWKDRGYFENRGNNCT